MIRLGVVVEGQTEAEFVDKMLAEHLRQCGIEPMAIPLRGNVSVQTLSNRMRDAYWSFDAVTSLVDFYGFRGKGEATVAALEERIAAQVRSHIDRDWIAHKVLPYVQRHEFEALLFADVAAFSAIAAPLDAVDKLRAVRSGFDTPEDIDDDPMTAPSKHRGISARLPQGSRRHGGGRGGWIARHASGLPTLRRLGHAVGSIGLGGLPGDFRYG